MACIRVGAAAAEHLSDRQLIDLDVGEGQKIVGTPDIKRCSLCVSVSVTKLAVEDAPEWALCRGGGSAGARDQ
jgi:hypothetical protein